MSDFYEDIDAESLKEKLGISFLTVKEKEGLETIGSIRDLIKEILGTTLRYSKILSSLKEYNIYPVGKGFKNNPEPVDFYKPITKTMIKKIFKKN